MDMTLTMWLEVINEVSERGTGFKACSPHVKFKSRKNSALFFDALLLRRESHFILWRQNSYLHTFFPNSDNFMNLNFFEIVDPLCFPLNPN